MCATIYRIEVLYLEPLCWLAKVSLVYGDVLSLVWHVFVNISATNIDWLYEVNINVTTTDWFSEINISATNIDCFTELNISVTYTDCFTEALFSKLQSPTLIVQDYYYSCIQNRMPFMFYQLSLFIRSIARFIKN